MNNKELEERQAWPLKQKIDHALFTIETFLSRTEGALPWLIATSVGYYLATTLGEMEGYVRSLESRANSIMEVAQAIRKQMDGTLF